jgi:signal transduction histidine kinase
MSLRHRVLALVIGLQLGAMAAYALLAMSLITQDRLAYVYDLNASRVRTLAEEVNANLATLREGLVLYGQQSLQHSRNPRQRAEATRRIFERSPDLVRVQVFVRRQQRLERVAEDIHFDALRAMGLESAALSARAVTLPFEALAAGELDLSNASVAGAVLLSVATAFHGADGKAGAVVAEVRANRLAGVFGGSGPQIAYLLDDRGQVLVHPLRDMVLRRANLDGLPIVKDALRDRTGHGVREFDDASGNASLGAFARTSMGRALVVSEVSRKDALRVAGELLRRSLLLAGAVLAAAFVVGLFFARRLTTPLERLREAAGEVAAGRYDVPLTSDRGDEIGDLARAFSRMAQAVRDAQMQLVQSAKMAAFGQMGAGVTHEIKNPLSAILGCVGLARQRRDDPVKVAECLALIEREAGRCKDILDAFLRFSRRQTTELEPTDLNHVVDEGLSILAHQLQTQHVRLRHALSADLPPVMANANQIQQVLVNLVLNAQQAMGQGGEVRVSTLRDGDSVVLSVADRGPGIPEAIRARIFEPFFTTKPRGEGTGLGLSVSWGIVRDHRGEIRVESTPGRGATFHVRLPAARPLAEATSGQASLLKFLTRTGMVRLGLMPAEPAPSAERTPAAAAKS